MRKKSLRTQKKRTSSPPIRYKKIKAKLLKNTRDFFPVDPISASGSAGDGKGFKATPNDIPEWEHEFQRLKRVYRHTPEKARKAFRDWLA